MPKQIIRECALQLQNALTNSELSKNSNGDMIAEKKADVCSTMLCEKLQSLKSVIPYEFQDTVNPEKFLKYLSKNNRHTSFPNIFIAVKNFLIIYLYLLPQKKEVFLN